MPTETVDLTQQASKQAIAARAEMEKRQLSLRKRPNFGTPRLPINLTSLDDDEIMELLVKFTKYQDYIAGQLSLIEIDESAAKSNLEVAKARHMVEGWTGASDAKVTISKARAVLDEKVGEAATVVTTLEAKRKVFSILENTMARDAAVVSREITRRTGSSGPSNRGDRHTP
jgi:hypothetical protein